MLQFQRLQQAGRRGSGPACCLPFLLHPSPVLCAQAPFGMRSPCLPRFWCAYTACACTVSGVLAQPVPAQVLVCLHRFCCACVGSAVTAQVLVCLRRSWCACTGSGVPAQVLECLRRFWCTCAGSGVPAQVMVCLHRLWCACAGYGVPAQVLVCLHRFWSACAGSGVPAQVLECLRRLWCACAAGTLRDHCTFTPAVYTGICGFGAHRWAGTGFNGKPLQRRQAERDAAVLEAQRELEAQQVGVRCCCVLVLLHQAAQWERSRGKADLGIGRVLPRPRAPLPALSRVKLPCTH